MTLTSILVAGLFAFASTVSAENLWDTLPPTPDLPSPIKDDRVSLDGASLWYQQYNIQANKEPVVMVHGGLGYSAYFGAVITRLIANDHYVIAVDRRGHGRSTYLPDDVFTYVQFGQETYELLLSIGVTKANYVAWSDGAISTMAALMNTTIAESISSAFLFGASTVPDETNSTFSDTAIFNTFVTRCAEEYAELQPSANFTDFSTKVATLEATLPQWDDADVAKLSGKKIEVVGAEHEEAVNRDVPEKIHSVIKGSTLRILKGVSHFAPVQDPEGFTIAVEEFLES